MKNDYVTIPKLTVDQMAEVHELRVKGVSWDNLGAIYNCGPTTVKRYYNMSKVTGFYMWNEHSPAAEKAMSMIKELSEENESLKIRMKQQADTFREIYDELVSQNNDIMKRINETDKLIDNLRGRDEEND
jgi:hypothetical protein